MPTPEAPTLAVRRHVAMQQVRAGVSGEEIEFRPGDLKYTREQARVWYELGDADSWYRIGRRLAPACSVCAAPEEYLINDRMNLVYHCDICGGKSSSLRVESGHIVSL